MKPLFAVIAVAVLGVSAAACDSVTTSVRSSAASDARSVMGDGDGDNPGDVDGDNYADGDPDNDSRTSESYRYHDKDDDPFLHYGHPAGAADARAVAAVVKRYYAVAGAGNGTAACSLLSSGLSTSVPEDYGRGAGPSYLRGGRTCPAVMTTLFHHFHNQLAGPVEVTDVRVKGSQAHAMLGSPTMPAGMLVLAREGRAWRLEELLGRVLR